MTRPHGSRFAGSAILALARRVYAESTVHRVFVPAVADLHAELSDAGSSVWRRAMVRLRWTWSLSLLFTVVPFIVPTPYGDREPLAPLSVRQGGLFIALLALLLYAATWPFFGWFVFGSLLPGAVLAWGLRAFYARHPTAVGTRQQADAHQESEINLSAIHVGGDVAGLMFAVGSVGIVLLGLPEVWIFFLAAISGSMVVAVSRFAWLSQATAGDAPSFNGR